MRLLDQFISSISHSDLFIFGIVLTSVALLYLITSKTIRSSKLPNDTKRRMLNHFRTFFFFILLSAALVLWATEFYQFVLSIAALAAGFAIAGKEIFLCFGGSFYKTFARPFSVGDRIEVNGIRGDVVDVGLMSTHLIEVGPKDYTQQVTGRTITIPNSLFLTNQVFNETDAVIGQRDFVLHVFKVLINNDGDWKKHKEVLIEVAQKYCIEYREAAQVFFNGLARKRHIDTPRVEPRVNIKFESFEEIALIVRVAVPVEKRGTIEQQIINDYLELSH